MRKRYRNYESREGTNGDAAFSLLFFPFSFPPPFVCRSHTKLLKTGPHKTTFIATVDFALKKLEKTLKIVQLKKCDKKSKTHAVCVVTAA